MFLLFSGCCKNTRLPSEWKYWSHPIYWKIDCTSLEIDFFDKNYHCNAWNFYFKTIYHKLFLQAIPKPKPWRYFLLDVTYLFCSKLTKKIPFFSHTFSYLQIFLVAAVQFWFWKYKYLFWPWNQWNKKNAYHLIFFFFRNSALVMWNELCSYFDEFNRKKMLRSSLL